MRRDVFSKYDIALFIDEDGKTRWKHLLRHFVENGSEKHKTKQKLSNCLKELVDEGIVNETIDPEALMFRMYWRVYLIYTVPKKRKESRKYEIRRKFTSLWMLLIQKRFRD